MITHATTTCCIQPWQSELIFPPVLSVFCIALYGSYVLQMLRPSGIENSTINFADFSVLLGFLSLAGFFVEGRHSNKIYLLRPTLELFAAALTGTRGTIFVFVVILMVLLVFYLQRTEHSRAKKLWIIVSVPIWIAEGYFATYALGMSRTFTSLRDVVQTLAGDPTSDVSTSLRMEHLSAGVSAFLDSPWFGHGWTIQIPVRCPIWASLHKAHS